MAEQTSPRAHLPQTTSTSNDIQLQKQSLIVKINFFFALLHGQVFVISLNARFLSVKDSEIKIKQEFPARTTEKYHAFFLLPLQFEFT